MMTKDPTDSPAVAEQKHVDIRTALMWVPLPLALAAIIVLRFVEPMKTFDRPYLLLLLNLTCSLLASILVIALLARLFFLRGKPDLLLVGCGLVFWATAGVAAVLAGLSRDGGGRFDNITVTVHNLSVLLSAACHFAGAIVAPVARPPARRTGTCWCSLMPGLPGSSRS